MVLTLDKESYHVGDVAKIQVTSPFAPCDGIILIKSLNGIARSKGFTMPTTSTIVNIPIFEEYSPIFLYKSIFQVYS